MRWETILEQPGCQVRRSGRFVVADLAEPHRLLSTSARNGGQVDHVRHVLNHQSCEGAGHHDRHGALTDGGPSGYHDRVCAEVHLSPDDTVTMGTAANMNYAALVVEIDGDLSVAAVVTAGVEGNATTAGEPATWRETGAGTEKIALPAGTINTMLFISRPLTPGALARAVMTMTEGKSAALHRLAVPSKLAPDLATGTGTDQYAIAAPLAGAPPLTSASPHLKLGELIGVAVRQATMEALRWQNGLEPSYTRGLFHALGRYGIREATLLDDIAPLLGELDLERLRRNVKAVCYEPLVGAAAHALAMVCDRVRYGMLPEGAAADAKAQQAASLAANLAACVDRWPEFRAALGPYAGGDVKSLALRALALGWSEKWRQA
jgi:adenosylcobinamide amidohydrolase